MATPIVDCVSVRIFYIIIVTHNTAFFSTIYHTFAKIFQTFLQQHCKLSSYDWKSSSDLFGLFPATRQSLWIRLGEASNQLLGKICLQCPVFVNSFIRQGLVNRLNYSIGEYSNIRVPLAHESVRRMFIFFFCIWKIIMNVRPPIRSYFFRISSLLWKVKRHFQCQAGGDADQVVRHAEHPLSGGTGCRNAQELPGQLRERLWRLLELTFHHSRTLLQVRGKSKNKANQQIPSLLFAVVVKLSTNHEYEEVCVMNRIKFSSDGWSHPGRILQSLFETIRNCGHSQIQS